MEDQRGTRVSCLRRCDERMRVNTCVNKSLVQALESCPSSATFCSANLSTFSYGNSKSAGLANAYMDSQKLDAILREPYSYWFCSCPKMASEAISKYLISKHFLEEHAPRSPQSCRVFSISYIDFQGFYHKHFNTS